MRRLESVVPTTIFIVQTCDRKLKLRPLTSMAATAAVYFFLFFLILPYFAVGSPSPYMSATTLFQDYQNMLTTLKIFIYDTPKSPFSFPELPTSLFYNSLCRSPFLTLDPAEGHLFFVPFSPGTSARSLARLVRDLRNNHPYWNRTLGADHFFVSPVGIDYSSDRNVLELKKNSVQVSVFPVVSGYFVPHKDITLPAFNMSPLALSHAQDQENPMTDKSFLGYMKWDGETEPNLVNELKLHNDFLVEESEALDYMRNVQTSKFCLFVYSGDVAGMVEAMSVGCVPVLIVDRPIQDLPFLDVLRWSDMALLVAARSGAERMKSVLNGVSEEKYMEMRELGVAASKHLVWNLEPQTMDAFHMVMYQLWLRRHVIRYARRDFAV
ncbi:probable glycosyltransferase At3g07620 [Primulina huaijiensis]|uniref:probable glycosyltransferase At3g07620 n=1 Tax=Primulina huaijiensis TaxID=1492673 RepID=UPI003CC74042